MSIELESKTDELRTNENQIIEETTGRYYVECVDGEGNKYLWMPFIDEDKEIIKKIE